MSVGSSQFLCGFPFHCPLLFLEIKKKSFFIINQEILTPDFYLLHFLVQLIRMEIFISDSSILNYLL